MFAVLKGNMKETDKDNKQKRQMKFMLEHSMTKEQQRKLIEDKLERARIYSEAFQKREMLLRGIVSIANEWGNATLPARKTWA